MANPLWLVVALLVMLVEMLCLPQEKRSAHVRHEVLYYLRGLVLGLLVIGLFYGGTYVWANIVSAR